MHILLTIFSTFAQKYTLIYKKRYEEERIPYGLSIEQDHPV